MRGFQARMFGKVLRLLVQVKLCGGTDDQMYAHRFLPLASRSASLCFFISQ